MTSSKPVRKPIKLTPYIKWIVLAIILAILAFFGYKKLNPDPVAPEYLTTTVKKGDIENTVLASGKIKAIETVDVGAQVSGEIVRLYVDVGDQVKKGDVIAQISQVEQKNVVSNAEASLAQAQSNLNQARGDLASREGDVVSAKATIATRQAELKKAEQSFNRLAGLIDIDAISREEYDDARATLDIAKANLAAAQASYNNALTEVSNARLAIDSQQAAITKARNDVVTAQEDLRYTTITAPMDGTIVSVSQKQGTTVNANQSAPTIVTLADLSRVRINAQISEADVVNITPNMPARFNIIGNPDIQYDAMLRGIEPAPETISSTSSTDSAVYYIGYLDVDNHEGKFRVDMTAQVNIIINAARDVLIVPSSALIEQDGKTLVRILGEDGFAKPVEVSVGINNRVNAEITSGLKDGDTIIIGEQSSDNGSGNNSDNNRRGNAPRLM
ncbi:efflux RND transporter periplasmic adaptor subunit [Moraxella sp. FZLJ2107]|uniref:efflux RND transporter periplasmic adaptor subunit n=1 Tax=unclassified Moraxella TaxID=2685852 RepID=UPI0020C8D861|nr:MULTISPECIES: efflux RND transporter periplasmic adaptor subunit [unclassified Moraxella]UTO05123.1 efflux RND transporter periplasmic adaptor subunit [Moraxella sp. FZLJ2107]UTO21858.1 efflux RND transporter periplasmic adaptor subunit [Moraxella sp. FZLJ2109]